MRDGVSMPGAMPVDMRRQRFYDGAPIAGDLADFRDAQGQMRTFFVHDPDDMLAQFEQAE